MEVRHEGFDKSHERLRVSFSAREHINFTVVDNSNSETIVKP